jgi:hypothetical protein
MWGAALGQAMGISMRLLRVRPLKRWPAERVRSGAVVTARPGSLGDGKAGSIWALPDADSDEGCRGWSWTSETDRHGGGE